ncbi:hypothetical protein EDB81DRAFT_865308 [Dactylonectria macrodidyma]|uniref:Phospholipase/carboxylesterase/thioesterase domain-containing protein n=1 Tax=Dactylonectria macrodidyma TaxID=307937 RepID=A0A9P9JLZ9_9HYPO|nr:hypothetical protein EDB81DRAFT_865308 [Dactylonectria macrodidyma]
MAGSGKLGFGPAHHTLTAMVLHGRGSGAEEFTEELMALLLSDGRGLREALPGWRWVFLSSLEVWSATFQEHMPAWFEAYSLAEPAKERLMVGGRVERLVLGGISQGGAVGIWTLLCEVDLGRGPGGLLGSTNGHDLFVRKMIASDGGKPKASFFGISMLLDHGLDDAYEDIELGWQASRILS